MRRFRLKLPFGMNNKGTTLPILLSYSLLFTLEAAGLALYAGTAARQSQIHESQLRSFYMAEAAVEKAVSDIRLFYANNGRPPTGPELDDGAGNGIAWNAAELGADFQYENGGGGAPITVAYQGGPLTQPVTSGNFAGLNATLQNIQVTATVRPLNTRNTTPVTMTQSVQIQSIPVFQFGVFYESDLEILPGPDMTFTGPVHTNSNLYMGSHNTLTFDSNITTAGDVFHGRKDTSGTAMNGDVRIKNPDTDTYEEMGLEDTNADGIADVWLDSSHPDWVLDSQSHWGGAVSSADHSVPTLKIPLPVEDDPHTLIERLDTTDTDGDPVDSPEVQAQKMHKKAQLQIIVDGSGDLPTGWARKADGTPVDLRYCYHAGSNTYSLPPTAADNCTGLPPGSGWAFNKPIVARSFTDKRENKTVTAYDIDIAMLNKSPTFKTIADAAVGGVVIYHSDHTGTATNEKALRLINGKTLYKATTFVSENPVYVKGHFNCDNPSTSGTNECTNPASTDPNRKKPAGIVSDAFTILSGNWNDANSNNSLSGGTRNATDTTVNVALITGNKDTVGSAYNGGFENIHRFLENWSSRTLSYAGSVSALYTSQIGTGNWVTPGNTGNVYNAPNRNWGFDEDFKDPTYVVPGFPSVGTISRTGWGVESGE